MKNSCQILNDGKNDGKDGYEKRMKKTCEKFITLHNGSSEVMLLVITHLLRKIRFADSKMHGIKFNLDKNIFSKRA
jgi:hypothetical protein